MGNIRLGREMATGKNKKNGEAASEQIKMLVIVTQISRTLVIDDRGQPIPGLQIVELEYEQMQ
jgi:hypothetical protein